MWVQKEKILLVIFFIDFIHSLLFREFLFFYRKVFIIFFTQFFQWKIEIKALTILLILFISLWQQAKENPYITDDLNSLDFKATLFTFGTIFGGFFAFECQNIIIEAAVLILIFFINVYFIYLWIRKMTILKLAFFKKLHQNYKWLHCLIKFTNKLDGGFLFVLSKFINTLYCFLIIIQNSSFSIR